MDNPFKKILHNKELPGVLKKKVLDDVAMIKLTLDLADLFVVKYPSTIGDLLMGGCSLDENRKKNKDKNKTN